MGAVTTLAEIRDLEAGAAYPGAVLHGCQTALILFAAGFLGKQDAYWIADAGLTATCIDADAAMLSAMRDLYPDGWEFFATDVYDYALQTPRVWDVVSLDPWTMDFDKCADLAPLWCGLACRAVILGTGITTVVVPPDGWHVTEVRQRSTYDGGVFWTVLERT